ncbi:uncharacterized protein [Diadema antillarum]|uniref:uncharacterized protein n=1 Tax=Diadema antillarum TaxID=105358 RepID=UPI003A87C84C
MATTRDAVAKKSSSSDNIMLDLQNQLRTAKINVPDLSTLAQKGEEKLVERFLSESVEVKGETGEVLQSQLYIAAFWGFHDVIKGLLEGGADINFQNKNTLWTPLHAAAFQEHGKVVMLLLQEGAQPELPDRDGRTATDFASASNKIWAHFAALGCPRTSKQDLISKGIIKKVSTGGSRPSSGSRPGSGSRPDSGTRVMSGIRMASYSRPESAYAIRQDPFSKQKNNSSQMAALLGGDILADEDSTSQARQAEGQPAFSVWRT